MDKKKRKEFIDYAVWILCYKLMSHTEISGTILPKARQVLKCWCCKRYFNYLHSGMFSLRTLADNTWHSVEDKLETLSIKLVSFLRGNSESNSRAKFIPMGFATGYQATPEWEGPNEDPDNERDICTSLNTKLEWLFLFIYVI